MSVVFINPPAPVKIPRGGLIVRPIGLFSLVSALQTVGIAAEVIDLHRFPLSPSALVERIAEKNFRVIGLSSDSYRRFEAISIANLLKQKFPDRPIIAGGPHFSKCADDALKHVSSIDIIVRGEGERVVQELVPALLGGSEWSALCGLSFRQGDRIRHNPDSDPIEDLDSLPIFTEFTREDYPEILAMYTENGRTIPAIGMLTSRGCPQRCLFCSATDGKYRTRSACSIVDEMQMWMERFPRVRGFNLLDLTFTAEPCHVRNVCEEIIARGLDIRWWAESRIDIDLNLLDLMHEAGCRGLSVGMESGSPRILKAIHKNVTLEMMYDFAEKSDSLGIWLDVFLMFSLPSETLDDLRMTLELVRDLAQRHRRVLYPGASGRVTTIHPGSPLESLARNKGIIPPDFSWHEPYYSADNLDLASSPYVPVYLDSISREDLKRAIWQSNYWIQINRVGLVRRARSAISALLSGENGFGDLMRSAGKRFRLRVGF